MPIRIFHQNMDKYGAGSVPRNAAYNAQFAAINAVTGPVYWAAGFTEVLSSSFSVRAYLSWFAGILDPGLTRIVVIEVGTCAVAAKPEYIGIAWDPNAVTVDHAGQVYLDPTHKVWTPRKVAAGAITSQTIPMPSGLGFAADTRGLAYIACRDADGDRFLIGFMHNMYKIGSKWAAFVNIPNMADKVRIAIGGTYRNAEVIIGGDFNVQAQNPTNRTRGAALFLKNCAARMVGGGGVPPALINTTLANPYDYWLVSNGAITDADARVHVQTRSPGCSDHAGITLER